jgi:hypothetical protein
MEEFAIILLNTYCSERICLNSSMFHKLIKSIVILSSVILLLTRYPVLKEALSEIASPSYVQDGTVMRSVRINGLDADFFYKVSNKPQKALILLGGSEGGKSWSKHSPYIQELLGLDYCILSLAYFGTECTPSDLREIPLEYFEGALDWLSTQKEVTGGNYALMGVSRGAELTLLLAGIYPQIKAVVAIAPSSVVFPGPPTSILDALKGQHSAWSLSGHELPFVPIPFTFTTLRGMITGNRTRMFEEALCNAPALEEAAIPIEKTQGPILLISFTHDEIWPSTLMCNQLMKRLKDKEFPFHYEHAAYDTTHSNWSFEPCWTTILTFLREHH